MSAIVNALTAPLTASQNATASLTNAQQQLRIKQILYCDIPFISQFKTLNEVLSGILRDVTWSFNAPDPKSDPNKPAPFAGLEISTADPTKTMFLRIKLDLNVNKVLTNYYCKSIKHDIGIHLGELFKILKIINKTDKVSLSIADNDKQRLMIIAEGKKKRVWRLKLREPNQKAHQSTVKEYKYIVTMKNEEFHTVCREMTEFAEYLEIKCTATNITFTCIGDDVDSSYVYRVGVDDVTIENDMKPDEKTGKVESTPYIYQGIFELKSLKLFSKCSSLCQDIKLYLINGFPITMNYDIGQGGSVVVLLTPKNEQSVNNTSFNYDDADGDSDEEDVAEVKKMLK